MISMMNRLPFHKVTASSWWSLGCPNLLDPPVDHFKALDTNATLSGEFWSIRLNNFARLSAQHTHTDMQKHKQTHTDTYRHTQSHQHLRMYLQMCCCAAFFKVYNLILKQVFDMYSMMANHLYRLCTLRSI